MIEKQNLFINSKIINKHINNFLNKKILIFQKINLLFKKNKLNNINKSNKKIVIQLSLIK